jgi:hypothetical protein
MDIRQAAEWLKEGKKVRRVLWNPLGGWPVYIVANEGDDVVREDTGVHFVFSCNDLIACDWDQTALTQ